MGGREGERKGQQSSADVGEGMHEAGEGEGSLVAHAVEKKGR